MRAAIILCLFAVALADQPGYNYHPVGHSNAGLSFAPGGDAAGSSDSPSYAAQASPSAGSPSYAPAEAELEKEFYSFTVPEEEFNEPAASDQIANSLKKNLRVIFIKGPENNGLQNAAINFAKHASESKTAIYVLQKQADIGNLANRLQAEHDHHASKPEVHFVKYRTPEDAANAQHAIQQQYDQLGGTSQSHDGGVAPVHNFASPGAAPAPARPAVAPGGSYLPASIIRTLRL